MSPLTPSNIWRDRCTAGLQFSRAEAEELVDRVAREPTDVIARLPLLVCCGGQFRLTHLAWFIEHMPHLDLGLFWTVARDRAQIERLRELWERALELNSGSVAVATNAAWAFVETDVTFGEVLLSSGARTHPGDLQWRFALRDYYNFVLTLAAAGLAESAIERTMRAISNLEELFLLQGDPGILRDLRHLAASPALSSRLRLYRTAMACIEHGDPGAPMIAAALVGMATGDLSLARERLLEGSELLQEISTAYPLLRELLLVGERGTVGDFLRRCANRWADRPTLETWAEAIDRGELPDFDGVGS